MVFTALHRIAVNSLVFWKEEWLVGDPFYNWNFRSTGPRWNEIVHFAQIFARSASAVTPSEKSSISTNRKSTTRFLMSLRPRWSSYVASNSPKRGLKKANGRFSSKSALCLKKVCYKFSVFENWQQQSCKAFIGLTWNFGSNWPRWSEIADFRYSPVASQP